MEKGERHGKLICLGKDPNRDSRYYLYKCECGNVKSIIENNVKRGATISCGCYLKANRLNGNCHRTYGFSHTRIDNIYKSMLDRCFNPRNIGYPKYGAKGITVCEKWRNDKKAFFEWAFSHGYREDLTIDRIDPLKGYSPDNCRWADYIVQNNHRSTNRFVEIDGVCHTIAEWSRISGIKQGTIQYRLCRGWKPKDAVFKALIPPKESGRMATIKED